MSRFKIYMYGLKTGKPLAKGDTEEWLMQEAKMINTILCASDGDLTAFVVTDTKTPGYEYPLGTWL